MRPTLLLLLAIVPLRAAPAEPFVLARLGDDRFRQQEPATVLTYSPDGRQLATGDRASVILWASADGRRDRVISLKDGSVVRALRYTADGKRLFVATYVGERTRLVKIEPATGKIESDQELAAGRWFPVFAPDGGRVVLYGHRHEDADRGDEVPRGLRCYRAADGKEVWNHPKAILFESVQFRPDGGAILVDEGYGPLHEYATATGVPGPDINVPGFHVYRTAYSPDGKRIFGTVCVPDKGHLFCWDLAAGSEQWAVPSPGSTVMGFLAGGRELVVLGRRESEEAARCWHRFDAATGEAVGEPFDMGLWDPANAFQRDGFPGFAGLAWHPDGKTVAVATSDGLIARWDLAAGKRLAGSADPPTGVTHLHLTAGGAKVRGWARGWYEWDVRTGAQSRLPSAVDIPHGQIVVPSPDGRWLARERRAPGRSEVGLEVVDLGTGKVQALDRAYAGKPFDFAGDRLLIHSDASVTVYEPRAGKVTTTVAFGSKRTYWDVDPDGSAIVALAVDVQQESVRGVRWDLRTGKKSAEWELPETEANLLINGPTEGTPGFSGNRLYAGVMTERALSRGGGLMVLVGGRGVLLDTSSGRWLADWEGRSYVERYTGRNSDFVFRPDNRSFLECGRQRLPLEFTSREVATGGVRGTTRFPRPVTDWVFTPDGRSFLVSTRTHPVEIWSFGDPPTTWGKISEADLWAALCDPDAKKAFAAIRHLWGHPTEAVAFLKARVKVPALPAGDWTAGRIRALDAAAFKDREKAVAELLDAGEGVLPALRAARPKASAEAQERLDGLLTKIPQTPARLPMIRACEVAEGLRTPAALELLRAWAEADPITTLGREARASVERLGRK